MKIWKILILSLITVSIDAQITFNRHHKGVGMSNQAELLITDYGYLIAAQNDDNDQQLDLIKLDKQGNILDTAIYTFDSVKVGIDNCGKCLHKKNGRIYYAQIHFEQSDSAYGKLIKLNSDLDTLLSITYHFKDSLSCEIRAMEFDSDSTFIVSGLVFRKVPNNLGKWDLLVAKFDTAFNLLWEKRIEDNRGITPLGYLGNDITIDSYGTMLVSGYGRYGPNIGFIARMDVSDGGMLWFKEFTDSLGAPSMFTVDNSNGTYQYLQHLTTRYRANSFTTKYNVIRTGIMDTTGTILSQSSIGPEDQLFFAYDLIPTMDGNFYAAGFAVRNGAYNSFGLKFAPNGDSLWMRYYHHQDQQDHSQLEIFFETPDSGFIHAGYFADLFQPTLNSITTWLLKTDKHGCDSIGCHKTSLPEIHVSGFLEVYPNPSNGVFRLQWLYGSPNQSFTIEVLDMTGRSVYKEKAILNEEEFLLDISQQPKGIYLLQISVKGQHILSRKIVLEH